MELVLINKKTGEITDLKGKVIIPSGNTIILTDNDKGGMSWKARSQ